MERKKKDTIISISITDAIDGTLYLTWYRCQTLSNIKHNWQYQ